MAITFPSTYQAWYSQANWLDGITALSAYAIIRFDSVTANDQAICGHHGSTNYWRLQKDNDGDRFHILITSQGVYKQVWDGTGAVVAGTTYHVAFSWAPGIANGLNLYRNGALVTSASTVGQSGPYNSGGNVDFYVSGISDGQRYSVGTIENLCVWTNYALDADQVMAMYRLGWPHLAVPATPAAYWPLNGELLTRIPDLSGNARHIESGSFDVGITAGGRLGKYEDPSQEFGGTYRQGASGPSGPNPWILWATVTHPTATSTVTGLTNGTTYEFKVNAVDTSDNESTDSATVEGTPATSGITYVHVPRRKWGGR